MWFNDVWSLTVSGIQEVAKYAARIGVGLCIETHIGYLTMSARYCIKLIDDVNMNNVGMLFDYAWVELAGAETGAEAVRKAARYISHIHIKDWKLETRMPLVKKSCLMGEGTVDWDAVLPAIRAHQKKKSCLKELASKVQAYVRQKNSFLLQDQEVPASVF